MRASDCETVCTTRKALHAAQPAARALLHLSYVHCASEEWCVLEHARAGTRFVRDVGATPTFFVRRYKESTVLNELCLNLLLEVFFDADSVAAYRLPSRAAGPRGGDVAGAGSFHERAVHSGAEGGERCEHDARRTLAPPTPRLHTLAPRPGCHRLPRQGTGAQRGAEQATCHRSLLP